MYKRQVKGFTLIELLVTITIGAILLAIALPSFQGSLRSNRVATTSNELLTSLNLARSEAIRSTHGGGVCASANGTACGADWSQGWMVWTETDGDGDFDDGETVVRYSQQKAQVQVTGSADRISFDGRGRETDGAGHTVSVVADGDDAMVRCVKIGITGQTGVKKGECT